MELFTTRPWNNDPAPLHVRQSPGMTSPAEKNMLYWLAKNYCTGSGHVIDAGCFMGASTLALAAGLIENKRWPQDRKVLAIDNFATTDGMIRLHTTELSGRQAGSSFFDVFQTVVAPVKEMVDATPSDFLAATFLPSPVELLFIDIAKTIELNQQVVRLGFTNLMPGQSLIVQQDYIYELCPWIIATMELYADKFEFIDFAFGGSFLFRFKGPAFTPNEIRTLEGLTYRDMLPLHRAAQSRIGRELDTIAGGTIDTLPKNIVKQVMLLSFVELVRLAEGTENAASTLKSSPLDDFGQTHMRSRINSMAQRVGVQLETV